MLCPPGWKEVNMKTKYGFIGTGNMGSALVKAVCRQISPSEVIVNNRTAEKAQALAALTGCKVGSLLTAAESKYIVLGVKPQMLMGLLEDLKDILCTRTDRYIIVSMAAGVDTDRIAGALGGGAPVIRIMPNTPVEIGKGVVLACRNDLVSDEEFEEFKSDFAQAGLVDDIDEKLMDAGSALSGCGPAFVYMAIEALADGAVQCGLKRDKAIAYAANTVMGASALLLERGEHPGALKDAVCSPGGSTIAGVHALERDGFRNALMDAVCASYDRTKGLG